MKPLAAPVEALVRRLRSEVEGEVRFDAGSRALYSTDASNYRQVPIGVVVPKTTDDVVRTVAACHDAGVPVLSRGGGTSLAGQCCNVAVVMDFSKYLHRVLEIDVERRLARVEPGVILDDLREAAQRHGLTFGPDPSTHNRCTLGGMIGNNSCGAHSVMAGRTADNVERLDILTYDGVRLDVGPTPEDELERLCAREGRVGEIYRRLRALRDRHAEQVRERYPDIPRRVSGYNLDELLPERGFHVARSLVGSEGTCVTVLEATVRLVPARAERVMVVLGYEDVFAAGDAVPTVMAQDPIALEGLDDALVGYMRKKGLHTEDLGGLPEGEGWLLAEFGHEDAGAVHAHAHAALEAIEASDHPPVDARVYHDKAESGRIWEVRESGLGATARVPGAHDTWPGWEDAAVRPDRVGDYLREFRALLDEFGYDASLYGHFGDGCIHVRIPFELRTKKGLVHYRDFVEKAADLVLRYGGSLSGEHGDGQSRGPLLGKMFGEELVEAFREFKRIWDPDWKMNPGKVVDADDIDENLVLGTEFDPRRPRTHFAYASDEGDFAWTTLRCVGVGKCRRLDSGVMCPSYMVTREEKHSTRGRARLLFEMVDGRFLEKGWKEEGVKEALDLCLACKGCKSDCPVDVDMATYKAEFLSHYFEGRLRPRSAYAMGWIYWWSRFASRAPGLVNAVAHAPVLGRMAKWAGGVAPARSLPRFAKPFTRWFRKERGGAQADGRTAGRKDVLLWPDTFNNHFHPDVLRAAVEVLEAAGRRVLIPPRPLCCGRPLYDYGMLDLAKRQLRQILRVLREPIEAGMPVVGLEPSCVAVFRDELEGLFPHDQDARRLRKQTFLLGEFLAEESDLDVGRLEGDALVHVHCHQHAVLSTDGDRALLDRLGLDYEVLDSGCCGMAGSFGFERDHYDVSVACGERVLLPRVREAAPATTVITNGFSCREQIEQQTGRTSRHLAQVLRTALRS